MKLGSLFDGSGGFPLAGAIHGITPVWASEIEAYPIKVTKARFPQMEHLGSVLDVNGAEIEPVDIITFGSPCQDLSVAGKQAGLYKGERSSLFFEAIRIIKEMRKATNGKYPRIAVWENVPGAYSSNKGEDFRAGLEAFAQINDEAADVPRPASGKWNHAGAIVGNGWSIAWRTFDAQFWGVPQRRKRIYLIADFGSERAGEILFEQEGVRGDSTPGGTAGEGTSDNAEGSAGRGGLCYAVRTRNTMANGWGVSDSAYTLDTSEGQAVCYPIDSHQQDSRFKVCADGISPTLPGQMGTGGNNGPMVLTKCAWDGSQVCSTLTANNAGGNQRMPDKDNFNAVIEKVRNDNGDAKKTRCREILLGLWEAYVEKTLQGSVGEQQGLQQTEILRPEVHGRALDKPTENRDKLLGKSCDCESGSGCWVLRNMREAECDGCASQGRQLSEQQPGQFDADLQELPQQATQGGGEVQDLRKESQRVGILREALSKVQEIWKPAHDKSQPVQRKYIIRRLTPLETCRLQGFPDWWEDGVQGSDSARYKMWGNGIALPNAEYVIGCAKKLIQGKHQRPGHDSVKEQ